MSQTHSLVWLTLSVVMAQIEDQPYCSVRYQRLCQGKGQHVACKFPYRGRGELCENYTAIIFSEDLKRFILHYVNRRRQRIALGHERVRGGVRLPKPKVMMLVQWDRELASLAQRLADQCQFLHDDCRATVRYPFAGQTVGEVRWRRVGESLEMGAMRTIRRVFDAWWGEKRRVQARQLISPFVLTARGAVWGHFSQLAVWTLRAMGCGAVHHGSTKPRLLLVCDFSHTNMLGQKTISPGPLTPCPMHTMRIATSMYPLLCSPGRLAQISEEHREPDAYHHYDEFEQRFESAHEEPGLAENRQRPNRPYETDEEARPRPNKPSKSDAVPSRTRLSRLDESDEVTRPWVIRPDDLNEDVNRRQPNKPEEKDEELTRSRPIRPEERDEELTRFRPIRPVDRDEKLAKSRPVKPEERDEELTRSRPIRPEERDEELTRSRPNRPEEIDEEATRSRQNRPDESDELFKRRHQINRPVRPMMDDTMDMEEEEEDQNNRPPNKFATRERTRTLEAITEVSVRYREDRRDGVFKQKLNSELNTKNKEKELRDRELYTLYKAAYKLDNSRSMDLRKKGEHKAYNIDKGEEWERSQRPDALEQWREYQELPLIQESDVAEPQEVTAIEVYRPTSLAAIDPLIRQRWKKPRNRPIRPGANALLYTPPTTFQRRQSKASLILLDKEDEDQLFLDTGFKISRREAT